MVQTEGGSISITGAPPGSTRFASANHHARTILASQRHGHPEGLAYAPPHHRHFPIGVRGWQASPYYYPSPYPYNYGGF
jgi:hypothetical protein